MTCTHTRKHTEPLILGRPRTEHPPYRPPFSMSHNYANHLAAAGHPPDIVLYSIVKALSVSLISPYLTLWTGFAAPTPPPTTGLIFCFRQVSWAWCSRGLYQSILNSPDQRKITCAGRSGTWFCAPSLSRAPHGHMPVPVQCIHYHSRADRL